MQRKGENQKEMLETFKMLAEDQLLRLNAYLMDLEKRPMTERREDLYRSILREYHNIKGSAGTVGQNDVMELAHAMEDILELMRQKKLEENEELFNLHYESLDAISLMIRSRLNGEALPGDVFENLHRRIEGAKHEVTPESSLLDSSVRQPKEETGKRHFLRKGNRHG